MLFIHFTYYCLQIFCIFYLSTKYRFQSKSDKINWCFNCAVILSSVRARFIDVGDDLYIIISVVSSLASVLYVTRGNERRTISHSVLSHVFLCYRWTLPRQRAWKMKVWRYATVAAIIYPVVLDNVNFCGLEHRCNAYKCIVSNGHWLVVASISWHISSKWIE